MVTRTAVLVWRADMIGGEWRRQQGWLDGFRMVFNQSLALFDIGDQLSFGLTVSRRRPDARRMINTAAVATVVVVEWRFTVVSSAS